MTSKKKKKKDLKGVYDHSKNAQEKKKKKAKKLDRKAGKQNEKAFEANRNMVEWLIKAGIFKVFFTVTDRSRAQGVRGDISG